MSEAPELLTAGEVAKRLRVTVQSVYRWAKSEDGAPPVLPGLRVGGTVRFRRADVDRLLDQPALVGDEPDKAAS